MIPDSLKNAVRSHRNGITSFIKTLNNPKICEVGVRYGIHFKELMAPNVSLAVAVDPWRLFESQACDPAAPWGQEDLDRQHDDFARAYAQDDRVTIERLVSLEAAEKYEDEFFDFIYIDANHGYEFCKEDLNAWYPKVKSGGYISGHDYIKHLDYGVIEAVEEFKQKNNIPEENFFRNNQRFASYYILKD